MKPLAILFTENDVFVVGTGNVLASTLGGNIVTKDSFKVRQPGGEIILEQDRKPLPGVRNTAYGDPTNIYPHIHFGNPDSGNTARIIKYLY